MRTEVYEALVQLVGRELADRFREQVDDTNDMIRSSGAIVRDNPTPPAPAPAKRRLVLSDAAREYLRAYRAEGEAEAARLKEEARLEREMGEGYRGIQRMHAGAYKLPYLRNNPEARPLGSLAGRERAALDAMSKKAHRKGKQ